MTCCFLSSLRYKVSLLEIFLIFDVFITVNLLQFYFLPQFFPTFHKFYGFFPFLLTQGISLFFLFLLQSNDCSRVLFNFHVLVNFDWRRKWQPTPVFLPGESQGWRSLVGSVYGVAQSRTRLKQLSSSSSSKFWYFISFIFLVSQHHGWKRHLI